MSARKPIFLSFFPLNSQDFEFIVYRRLYEHDEMNDSFPGYRRFRLPENISSNSQDDNYTSYWVGFEPSQGFEEIICNPRVNDYLTLEYLYQQLKKKCKQVLSSDEYVLNRGFIRRRINFVMYQCNDGQQTVWLEPYFLKSKRLFGFLVDFKFLNESDGKQSEKALKLSLSLDKHGRRNRNFYIDRYDQIQKFVAKHKETVFDLAPDVSIHPDMCPLDVNTLEIKSYVFVNDRSSRSQFRGIKEHGPLSPVNDGTKVYFIFREKDRSFSYDLFRALRGDTFPNTFPGMEVMFRYRFDGSNVGGIPIIEDFTFENLQDAIQDIRQAANGCPVVPIFIAPFDKFNADDTDREVYYKIKHFCLQNSIPSQFVGKPLLRRQKKNLFKWATSNIALQIFAKMGGQPWKLEPETKKCLIVGIGQAHNKEQGIIKKYFAYSILTESTGLYKELKILGDTHKSEQYIEDFKHNLKKVFDEYYNNYDSFVVHTTFKIRRNELEAVQEVIESMDSDDNLKKDFIVMKFNDRNKFFGYSSETNSMIPYESSYIKLSYDEYLVWFEGLQYHNPNAGRKIERPLHVEFIFANRELDDVRKRDYLQDALNISGANWRGFNAKSLPISVHYAYLVAQYYKEFQKLGLEEVNLEAIKPWFL